MHCIYNEIECHLRNLESLKQDINYDIFVTIISSKTPKEVLLQLVLKRGTTEKWTASILRNAFKNMLRSFNSRYAKIVQLPNTDFAFDLEMRAR